MPLPPPFQPPSPPKAPEWKLRSLKRGDRDAAFKLLAADGWKVDPAEQELALSWVVQHPEMESFVAHDPASFSRLYGMITMSHRPQLRLGGRVACIDLFLVAPEHRSKGIGHALLVQSLRRAQALGCKRMELILPDARGEHHAFFEDEGFGKTNTDLYVRAIAGIKG